MSLWERGRAGVWVVVLGGNCGLQLQAAGSFAPER